MTECNTGDVVILPFPFTDFSTLKQRPALIISSRAWNKTRDDVIVVAISSKINRSEFEYVLDKRDQKSGGLRAPSVVRFGNIYTVDKRLVRENIGALSPNTLKGVVGCISKIIG